MKKAKVTVKAKKVRTRRTSRRSSEYNHLVPFNPNPVQAQWGRPALCGYVLKRGDRGMRVVYKVGVTRIEGDRFMSYCPECWKIGAMQWALTR